MALRLQLLCLGERVAELVPGGGLCEADSGLLPSRYLYRVHSGDQPGARLAQRRDARGAPPDRVVATEAVAPRQSVGEVEADAVEPLGLVARNAPIRPCEWLEVRPTHRLPAPSSPTR